MAGLTVSRGILGFGPASRRENILLRHSEDLPIVIESVDSEEKIAGFLPLLDSMIGSGLAITGRINVVRYGPREHGQSDVARGCEERALVRR